MSYLSVIPENWKKTIRERVVEQIELKLTALRNEVEGYENEPLFRTVGRGDPDELPEVNVNSAPAAYVEDGDEENVGEWTCQNVSKQLQVYVHLRLARGQQGVEPYTVFNYYLGRIQQALLSDTRLGNTCTDVTEQGNSPQVFPNEGIIGGTLVLAIKYRHQQSDPTTNR